MPRTKKETTKKKKKTEEKKVVPKKAKAKKGIEKAVRVEKEKKEIVAAPPRTHKAFKVLAEGEVLRTPKVFKVLAEGEVLIPQKPKERYFEALGRRKTAIARVRLFTQGEKVFLVNEKPYQDYFKISEHQQTVISPLEKMKCLDRFRVLVKVKGGGLHAQAEAIRHGMSRALLLFNPDFRKRLKKAGYLTRDARMRERKKFGLKRARRAPQWQKR